VTRGSRPNENHGTTSSTVWFKESRFYETNVARNGDTGSADLGSAAFLVVIHAGQIASIRRRVINQTRADHDSKAEPAEEPEDKIGGREFGNGLPSSNGQERSTRTGLEQLISQP